jgi:hypothetical protein
MDKQKEVLMKVGWTLSSPGILVTLVVGLLTILGIPFFETNLSKTASQEIALGILGITVVMFAIAFCTLTPIWVLTKLIKISTSRSATISTLMAIMLSNLIPASILGYGLYLQKLESDQIKRGKFAEIEFNSINDAIRSFDRKDFMAPPVATANKALLYILKLEAVKRGIEDGKELGYNQWKASATSYDLLPIEERGGKIPIPTPYRIKIKSLGPIVPSRGSEFGLRQNGEIIGDTSFQSYK